MTTQTLQQQRQTIPSLIDSQLNTREHLFVEWSDLVMRIATDPELEGSYAGTYSLTLKNRSQTFVDVRHTWCGKPVSASSISRLALGFALQELGRKRFFWTMKALPQLERTPPYFCIPGYHDNIIYVDIKSCYYELFRRLPLYLYYWGLRPIYGEQIFDSCLPFDIGEYKLCRNSMIGTIRSFHSTRVRDFKLVKTNNRNKLLMPCHWGCMVEILHHFAQAAVAMGAIYYNTDGAIFRGDADALKWIDLIASWGLKTDIKAKGSGFVQALGSYKIGNTGTVSIAKKQRHYNNLEESNKDVLVMWRKLLGYCV